MHQAQSHLSLLDRVVRRVFRLIVGGVRCDLWHRLRFATLFYHIRGSVGHSVGQLFPKLFTAGRRGRPTPP